MRVDETQNSILYSVSSIADRKIVSAYSLSIRKLANSLKMLTEIDTGAYSIHHSGCKTTESTDIIKFIQIT